MEPVVVKSIKNVVVWVKGKVFLIEKAKDYENAKSQAMDMYEEKFGKLESRTFTRRTSPARTGGIAFMAAMESTEVKNEESEATLESKEEEK